MGGHTLDGSVWLLGSGRIRQRMERACACVCSKSPKRRKLTMSGWIEAEEGSTGTKNDDGKQTLDPLLRVG